MAKPLSMTFKANIIGIAALLITGVYLAYDLTHAETARPCSELYPPSVALNMDLGNGELLSNVALQARSGSQDWGVIEKLSIEHADAAPAPHVFKFTLPKGDFTSRDHQKGGAGFPWRPSRLEGTKSVCFGYNLWIPDDFDFSVGGILPGVASEPVLQDDGKEFGGSNEAQWTRKLRSHIAWSDTGTLQAITFDPSDKRGDSHVIVYTKTKLQAGRWHRLQEELVLNDEGKRNGAVRLWLDGALIGEQRKLSLRATADKKIETVLYHVSRGTPLGNGSNVKIDETAIRVSPLTLSWH